MHLFSRDTALSLNDNTRFPEVIKPLTRHVLDANGSHRTVLSLDFTPEQKDRDYGRCGGFLLPFCEAEGYSPDRDHGYLSPSACGVPLCLSTAILAHSIRPIL